MSEKVWVAATHPTNLAVGFTRGDKVVLFRDWRGERVPNDMYPGPEYVYLLVDIMARGKPEVEGGEWATITIEELIMGELAR